jgi:hypothetical protein
MKNLIKKVLNKFNIAVVRNGYLMGMQDLHKDLDEIFSLPSDDLIRLAEVKCNSKSQIKQDLFVLLQTKFKENGFFVEFGATNGVDLSNTHLLEKDFTTKKGSKVHHIKGHYIQEAVAPYMTAGKRKPPSFKNVFNDIKQVGTYIKPLTKGVASALNKKIISGIEAAGRPSIHAGKRKPPSFKNVFNDIKQGLSMIEASKYVKQHGLYTK